MKKVFLINSHTTYFSALAVINQLHLQNDDVRMIYVRNYNNALVKNDVSSIDLSIIKFPFSSFLNNDNLGFDSN